MNGAASELSIEIADAVAAEDVIRVRRGILGRKQEEKSEADGNPGSAHEGNCVEIIRPGSEVRWQESKNA